MTYFPIEALSPLRNLAAARRDSESTSWRRVLPPRPFRLPEVLSDHLRRDVGLPPAERGIDYWRFR